MIIQTIFFRDKVKFMIINIYDQRDLYYCTLFNFINFQCPAGNKRIERDRNRGIERDRTFYISSK